MSVNYSCISSDEDFDFWTALCGSKSLWTEIFWNRLVRSMLLLRREENTKELLQYISSPSTPIAVMSICLTSMTCSWFFTLVTVVFYAQSLCTSILLRMSFDVLKNFNFNRHVLTCPFGQWMKFDDKIVNIVLLQSKK